MRGSAPAVRWLAVALGLTAALGLTVALGSCTASPELSDPPGSPPDPFAQAALSVVSIEVGPSSASGIVLTADGHILTSNLVVTGAAGDPVTVTSGSDDSWPAIVVGDDPRTGLAVIKVDEVPDLIPAVFGDSDAVATGDEVRALGGPLVSGESSSSGTVLDTSLTVGSVSMIGTDAPAVPGTAGGPLVNPAGEVIGIVAGTSSAGDGSAGSSFALPSNPASRVAGQLIAGDLVAYPYLGVAAGVADGGALVEQVVTGSPAGQAGLQPGDVITRVGGRPVGHPDDLLAAVQSGGVGDQLTVGYTRDGAELEVTVTLGAAPADR